jgi:small nuclear ribonucleoprotein (snRNP)-like protein
MNEPNLQQAVGKQIKLTFSNGQIVRAKLITYDPHTHEDIIYDLIEVIATGNALIEQKVGDCFMAPLHNIIAWEPVQ